MSELKTAISGSFKFKKEIDELHDEFADYGVEVLEPTMGWLFTPTVISEFRNTGFRPLPAEKYIKSIGEVEERFLRAIRKSDFLYLYNAEQYIGVSAAMEIGCAHANNKPIYSKEPISIANAEYNLDTFKFLKNAIKIATPAEAASLAAEHSISTKYC
jgi:hypothetical protein